MLNHKLARYLRLQFKQIIPKKFTLMFVPHNTLKPLHLQFSFPFAVTLVFFWTALTSWATWAVISNVDYWTTKADHEILKLKVSYYAMELRKNREFLDQVRQADIQIRKLLGMKDRQTILGADPLNGKGGPEPFERSILEKELSRRIWDLTGEEISRSVKTVRDESKEEIRSYKEIAEYVAFERGLYRGTPRGYPAEGRLTSRFGLRISPFSGLSEFHAGLDIANDRGTPVHATADGIVEVASWQGGYGNLVAINHSFGYLTFYGHNSVIAVKAGDRVSRGQVIAYMGSTGSSTGDHCHYEVWRNGQPVDPWRYCLGRPSEELSSTAGRYKDVWKRQTD